jgi:hypothetical protein
MGEDRFKQVNANNFHGLTMCLINGHSECQLQGELAPLQGEWPLRTVCYHGDVRYLDNIPRMRTTNDLHDNQSLCQAPND